MMILIHRSFFSMALVLALFGLAGAQGAVFTVQFKASPTREEAEDEVRQLKARNISAYIIKSVVPGRGVFYRVRAGVFSNRDEAKKYGANLQERGIIAEFIVMPYEKPADELASRPAPAPQTQPKTPARTSQPAPNVAPDDVAGPTRPPTQKRPDSAP